MSWFKKFGRKKGKSSKNNSSSKNETNNGNNINNDNNNGKHSGGITIKFIQPTKLKDSYTKTDVIQYSLPLIRSVQVNDKRKNLVITKLRLCSVVFDFIHLNDIESKGIEIKRAMLVEIVEYISSVKWWNEDILKELINCMKCNLFRTLPSGNKTKFVKGDEEEEPFQDPSWLHLQLIYELCLRFLISNDINKPVMQKYLKGKFVLSIIQLFQSEDMRERDYLKTILHRIYGRFMQLRVPIRKEISNECYRYIYSKTRGVHGIAEFLDIFSSIINGFSIPVKLEHKNFLKNVLIPLHKCDKYDIYFQQLADCCVLFVNKEQSIAKIILAGLLKYWPYLSPTKQAFFLREMLNVIGALVEHENGFEYKKYKDILTLCINKIFDSMISSHFQVADQAINLWRDTVMLHLSRCDKENIWRRLFMTFENNLKNHWNPTIVSLTQEVLEYYKNIDTQYWNKLNNEYKNNKHTNDTNQNSNNNNNTNGNNNNKNKIALDPDVYINTEIQKNNIKKQKRKGNWQTIASMANNNKSHLNNNNSNDNGNNNSDSKCNNDDIKFLEPDPDIFSDAKKINNNNSNNNINSNGNVETNSNNKQINPLEIENNNNNNNTNHNNGNIKTKTNSNDDDNKNNNNSNNDSKKNGTISQNGT